MYCTKCGAKIDEDSKFCTKCGAKVERSATNSGNSRNTAPHSKGTGRIIVIVGGVCLLIALIAVVAVPVFFAVRGNKTEQSTQARNATDHAVTESDTDTDPAESLIDVEEQESQPDTVLADSPLQDDAPAGDMLPEEETVSEYILQDSDSRYLTKADLHNLSAEECRLARNEIYARYGRKFDDEGLQSYFNACSWYHGTMEPADFQESMLNAFEIANRDLIVEYEKEMGYR